MDTELPIIGGILTFLITFMACWHRNCRRKTFGCVCKTDEDDCQLGVNFRNKQNNTMPKIQISEIIPEVHAIHTQSQQNTEQSSLGSPVCSPNCERKNRLPSPGSRPVGII